MSLRPFADNCIAGGVFALTLLLASPASAQDARMLPSAPALPANAMPLPAAPDMRPEWRGGELATLLPDSRTRDAWLRECRRRTAMYYDNGRSHRRRNKNRDQDRGWQGGYDYCEAYFDDYYRTYQAHSHAYGHPTVIHMRPAAMTASRTIQTSQPVEEVITEEYVPEARTNSPRRPARRIIRDKRVRVAP